MTILINTKLGEANGKPRVELFDGSVQPSSCITNFPMLDVRALGKLARAKIDELADSAIEDIHWSHYNRMLEMDHEEEMKAHQEMMKLQLGTHDSIESWLAAQSEEDQDYWSELYHCYQYMPGGDAVLDEGMSFKNEVIMFLRGKDSYLKQTFCPYCDSRGHESGSCMKETKS